MDYESMTVPQLKDIARSNNLKNWSRLKKADLIQFLIDNVPRGAVGGLPPSRGRGRTPRRRSPSPAPRPRTPSPRPIPPSPPRTPSPSSGLRRPRSRTPSRSLRRRSPARIPSGPFGIAKLKKRQCVRNLRKDVVAVAEDYGISITKADGKKKTIKELCVEIDIAGAQQLPMPVAATPPRTHTPSPLQIPRPITPPILESVPTGMIPRAVVYALLNIDRDMTKADLLKPKVLNKPTLVRYAEELGIKGKSLTKEVLLDRIVAAQVARDMPVMAQAIEDESEVIADEIVDHVSEMVIAAGEQPPAQEEVQAVVQQRVSTGESVRGGCYRHWELLCAGDIDLNTKFFDCLLFPIGLRDGDPVVLSHGDHVFAEVPNALSFLQFGDSEGTAWDPCGGTTPEAPARRPGPRPPKAAGRARRAGRGWGYGPRARCPGPRRRGWGPATWGPASPARGRQTSHGSSRHIVDEELDEVCFLESGPVFEVIGTCNILQLGYCHRFIVHFDLP